MSRRGAWAISTAFLLLAGACSEPDDAGPLIADFGDAAVVVSSSESTTSQVLGTMLVILLEENGTVVDDQVGFGSVDQNRDALLAGEIDVYPEDVSTGWQIHLGERVGVLDGIELAAEVGNRDLRRNDVRWSGVSEFDASLGFAAKPRNKDDIEDDLAELEATADEVEAAEPSDEDSVGVGDGDSQDRATGGVEVLDDNGWSLGALARILERDEDSRLCLTQSFLSSREGLVRFEEFTGFTVPNEQLVVIDEGEAEEAEIAKSVADGTCVAGTMNRVSGHLRSGGLVPIGPPSAGLFPPRNYGYSFTKAAFDENERLFTELTMGIFNSLDRATMAALNASVELDENSPADVALKHLREAGLVEQ